MRWALLVSLLLNHALLGPALHALLLAPPADPPPAQPVEVDLVPAPEPPQPQARERRAPSPKVARTLPVLPLPRPEPKRRPPQEKPPQPQPEPPRPPEPLPRMKMVEVNTPETDKSPEHARFLSDKNRRVELERRARTTNLKVDQPKPQPQADKPHPERRPDPGHKQPRVAQTERRDSPQRRDLARKKKRSPLMVMRPQPAPDDKRPSIEAANAGDVAVPEPRAAGRTGQKPRLERFDHKDFDRIYGDEARRQRELARLAPSRPAGRYQKKWQRIQSALENFVPEVQPGNQTALNTRAHPFAVYIARMHRRIHNLWGFGFLVDLDNKPDAHPMNDMTIWTMVEVVVNPDGEVAKTTIVKPSGVLAFDVAALDTVYTAGPFSHTPRAIRSRDGKVYLHWRFHRDHRQCGTFGVDPYILTKPPSGPIDGDLSEVAKGTGQAGAPARALRRLNRPHHSGTAAYGGRRQSRVATPRAPTMAGPRRAATLERARDARRAAQQHATGDDPAARATLARFLRGFAAGDTAAMAAACGVPFASRGSTVAKSRAQLRRMFGDLLRESTSRAIGASRLLTPLQARARLGHMPPGVTYGAPTLIGQVKLGDNRVTVVLRRHGGRWHVVGLDR